MAEKKFVLTEVYDREIYNKFFETFEEAQEEMYRELDDMFDTCFLESYQPIYGEDYMRNSDSCYINGSCGNIDWAIDEIH